MIEISRAMRPSSREEATQIADKIDDAIERAREDAYRAKQKLLGVCVEQFPVGTQVSVNIAARRSLSHKVISINENGWMTLRNVSTGTERGMMADSSCIKADRCWYEEVEKESK